MRRSGRIAATGGAPIDHGAAELCALPFVGKDDLGSSVPVEVGNGHAGGGSGGQRLPALDGKPLGFEPQYRKEAFSGPEGRPPSPGAVGEDDLRVVVPIEVGHGRRRASQSGQPGSTVGVKALGAAPVDEAVQVALDTVASVDHHQVGEAVPVEVAQGLAGCAAAGKAGAAPHVVLVHVPVDEEVDLLVVVVGVGEDDVDETVAVEVPQVDELHLAVRGDVGVGAGVAQGSPVEFQETGDGPALGVSGRTGTGIETRPTPAGHR